jgi:hypothetical protein
MNIEILNIVLDSAKFNFGFSNELEVVISSMAEKSIIDNPPCISGMFQ